MGIEVWGNTQTQTRMLSVKQLCKLQTQPEWAYSSASNILLNLCTEQPSLERRAPTWEWADITLPNSYHLLPLDWAWTIATSMSFLFFMCKSSLGTDTMFLKSPGGISLPGLAFPFRYQNPFSSALSGHRLRRSEGRDQTGAGPGVSGAGPPSFRLQQPPGRAARGRRWSRAAPRVAEQPKRPSLPRRAPRRPAAVQRVRLAAGQSGRQPTWPRPCRGLGRRVGRGPGWRRGAPRKGPIVPISWAPRAAGSGFGPIRGSRAAGAPAGLSGVPTPPLSSRVVGRLKWGPWADPRPHLRLSEPDCVLARESEFTASDSDDFDAGGHRTALWGHFLRGQRISDTAGSLSGCIEDGAMDWPGNGVGWSSALGETDWGRGCLLDLCT